MNARDLTPPPSLADGLCREVDPDLWFPEDNQGAAPAKRVCMSCDGRAECLEFALTTRQQHGVWGGLSYRDRIRLTSSRKEAA